MREALTYGLISLCSISFSQDTLQNRPVQIDSVDIHTLIEIAELEGWMQIEKDPVAMEYDSLEWFRNKTIHWLFPEISVVVTPTIDWKTAGPWVILWDPVIWPFEPLPITKIERVKSDSTTPVGSCACTQAAKRTERKRENDMVNSNDQSPTEPFESTLPLLATIPPKLEYKLQNEQ